MVEDALVVLGRRQREKVVAVHQGHERGLLADEQLLDDHPVAGPAEDLPAHDAVEGGFGFGPAGAQDHSLARGQTVRLDRARLVPAHVSFGLVEVREDLAGGGGDAVLQHQFLGEGLAALEPGRLAVGSEHLEASALEQVADPQHQRLLRAHHGEVDGLPGSEIGQLLDLAGGDVHGLSLLADAGAAGGAVELVHPGAPGALAQLPRQRMLPPAAADD